MGWILSPPAPCPRCGLEPVSIFDQTRRCAYCNQNARRLIAGRPVLPEPTDEYPTWSPKTDGAPAST